MHWVQSGRGEAEHAHRRRRARSCSRRGPRKAAPRRGRQTSSHTEQFSLPVRRSSAGAEQLPVSSGHLSSPLPASRSPAPLCSERQAGLTLCPPPSPLRRGPVSAREPARFIHCTSTFPTGIISIKPSALPSSLGPHPLGRLRHCSTCEPGRADAAALPSPADAAGGSDTLPKRCLSPPKGRQLPPKIKAISLPLREDAASPAASKGGLGGEEVLATAAALVQKRSPTCQVWMSFGSDTPHGRRSAGFNGLFISVSAF